MATKGRGSLRIVQVLITVLLILGLGCERRPPEDVQPVADEVYQAPLDSSERYKTPLDPGERNGSHALSAVGHLLADRKLPPDLRDVDWRELRLDTALADPGVLGRVAAWLELPEHRLALDVLDLYAGVDQARFPDGDRAEVEVRSNYANLRLGALQAGHLLRLRAILALVEDRAEDAYSDLALALRVADWLDVEYPSLLSSLLARAVVEEALGALEEGWQVAPPSAAARATLGERIARLTGRGVAWGLEQDRRLTGASLQASEEWKRDPEASKRWIGVYDELIEVAKKAPYERSGEPGVSPVGPVLQPGVDFLIPNLLDAISKNDVSRMRYGLAGLALAWEDHRDATGAYPSAPEELVPERLDAVPEDLFTGEPLTWRRDDGVCVVYSVGPNGRDDGGVDRRTPTEADDADDVAWRLPCS